MKRKRHVLYYMLCHHDKEYYHKVHDSTFFSYRVRMKKHKIYDTSVLF